MEPIFNVVLPVFAIILTGYACGRFGVLGAASSEAINKFVYFVALPGRLFFSMGRVNPDQIFNWPYLGAFAAGSVITTVIAILFARWVFKTRLSEQSMFGMVAIFGNTGQRIPLHLAGTNFQIRVWEALLRIPDGALVPYQWVAQAIGQPKAARAVGAAVGANPISWFIPCHRALAADGRLHNYHWGVARKRAMLTLERACAA